MISEECPPSGAARMGSFGVKDQVAVSHFPPRDTIKQTKKDIFEKRLVSCCHCPIYEKFSSDFGEDLLNRGVPLNALFISVGIRREKTRVGRGCFLRTATFKSG